VGSNGSNSNNTYEHTATLQGHEGPVWQVSWAHPKYGVLLASCGFDGSVLIHRETRPRDWTLVYSSSSSNLHESSVNSLAFGPHELGLKLAAASSDGKVSVLTHQPDQSWTVDYLNDSPLGVNAVSWAPAGAYYNAAAAATFSSAADDADATTPDTATAPDVAPEQARLVTGGCDNRIRFWIQTPTGTWEEDSSAPISSDLSHSDWVRDVAWAPPLIPNQNVVASCSEDKTVLIWTQSGGAGSQWKPTLLHEFDAPVWRVSWSLTAHMLAVSSGDNDVTLWRAGLDGSWSQMSSTTDPVAAAAAAM
jgi:protein transport protein SEC13